jgi:hypothetical protein
VAIWPVAASLDITGGITGGILGGIIGGITGVLGFLDKLGFI